jgi:hypothetical protein
MRTVAGSISRRSIILHFVDMTILGFISFEKEAGSNEFVVAVGSIELGTHFTFSLPSRRNLRKALIAEAFALWPYPRIEDAHDNIISVM